MKPKSKLSFFRSINELRKRQCELKVSAEAIVGALLTLWCNQKFPGLGAHGLESPKELNHERSVVAFAAALSNEDFLESTYWLSSTYAMLANEQERKKLAMFFTPSSLVRGLLDDLVTAGADFSTDAFHDPACGGAAFLAPIAIRMREALRARGKTAGQVLLHVEERLSGIDIEPNLCKLSRHFLSMALHAEIRETGLSPRFNVSTGDSLRSPSLASAAKRVVVCNPPYRKMTSEELAPLRPAFGHIIEGQPNVYALFIAKCVELAGKGGIIGLVTPTSFLSGQYFRKLRNYLMENTSFAHIGMVGSRLGVFIDVEQETALCILKKKAPEDAHSTNVRVSVVSGEGVYTDVGECALPNSGAAWPIPREPDDVKLLELAGPLKFRLTDYGYRVRIGLFVWNRDERPAYASMKHAKRAGARHALPLIWSKDIVLTRTGAKVAFLPDETNLINDRFVDLGSTDQPGVITRPSVVLQRVTSNGQPLRLVAASVPKTLMAKYKGFVGENHIVILEQAVDHPAASPRQLAALLRSRPVDRYFRCISGATNVSAFELGQLVLPDPVVLKQELAKGGHIDEAVLQAFKSTSTTC
jgi:adenine-specific DNA-methyltransferase